MNLPTPPQPSSLPPQRTSVSELQAWHELKDQMELLHAQLLYLKLMLKLGVNAW